MSKHTPGPWNDYKPVSICQQDDVGLQLSFLSTHNALRRAEGAANARLIAAAPDLLEACEAHIAALRSQIRDGKYRPEYAEVIYQAQKKMEAAISKARGES